MKSRHAHALIPSQREHYNNRARMMYQQWLLSIDIEAEEKRHAARAKLHLIRYQLGLEPKSDPLDILFFHPDFPDFRVETIGRKS